MTEARNVIVIGSSTGGPRVLERVFTNLPKLKASIIVVHQMPKMMNRWLNETLDESTDMHVSLAESGQPLEQGHVYVAPSEIHLRVAEENSIIQLQPAEQPSNARPSIDIAMESLVVGPEDKIVGVLLTGPGTDGVGGISHIKRAGGITIAQDERSCPVAAMPKAAFETGDVDYVATPEEIRDRLIQLVGLL